MNTATRIAISMLKSARNCTPRPTPVVADSTNMAVVTAMKTN